MQIEADLRRALARNEFVLFYQPQVDTQTGEVRGFEALLRWWHSQRGLLTPADFIPVAEESGVIVPIGDWVLRQASAQMAEWRKAGLPPVRLSVNISARQLESADFVDSVMRAVQVYSLDGNLMELEITESLLMRDFEANAIKLGRLSAAGIRLAIDDFGIGYSSFKYLSRFPIHTLKIDQSFVQELDREENMSIVNAMEIAMGRGMGLNVVDEAVICPGPVYPPFIHNVLNAQAVPIFNPLDFRNGMSLDLDDLKRRITPRSRMLMVSNPHNPTGRVFTRKELEGIAEIAQKHNLLIFTDELYEDMLFEGEHVSIASLSDDLFRRTVTVFGFSKAFGIPGYRIAYIVTGGEFAAALKKRIHDVIVHADTLAQAAAKAALTTGSPWISKLMAHLKEMRDYGVGRLTRIPGVSCPVPQATPFLFPDISGLGMKENSSASSSKKTRK